MDTQVEFRGTRVAAASLAPCARVCDFIETPSIERLAASWNALITGCSRIVAEHSDKKHHFLELAATRAAPLQPRELARWCPILLGTSLKVVAADLGCSNSSVASSAAHCLKTLGLNRTSKEAPILLAMMAHASESLGVAGAFSSTKIVESVVVAAVRPDLALASVLSPSEMEVVRLRVDGLSHVQIAAVRLTALRTVANQLAGAYLKLGVSSRPELLAALIKGTWRRDWRSQRAMSVGNRLTHTRTVFANFAQ